MRTAAASLVTLLAAGMPCAAQAQTPTCTGSPTAVGAQTVLAIEGGGAAVRARMNINIDGSPRAYNKANAAGGALIHLCNAGRVYLPDGSSYEGSESNATCTGRFMDDVKRIGEAGWKDPSVGVVQWYGILGRGEAEIAGRTVRNVEPVEVKDAPGFYVSPTTLADPDFAEDDPQRYPDPMLVPGGVMPSRAALKALGVKVGGFGVAIDTAREDGAAVPFIINDTGPRIGEGSVALARLVAGKEIKAEITRAERYAGQVDKTTVLWVFFGGDALAPPYDAERVRTAARDAFDAWGGETRLKTCMAATAPLAPVSPPQ
ncbi:MAG: hypothetical protein GC155_05455 [Alphaproteobacteria bacterium]|nr:hypothetical protein [Alphaproteobacteria bacterium]